MPETIENQQSKNSSEVCLHTTLSLGGLVDMLEAIPPVLTSTTNYATCKKKLRCHDVQGTENANSPTLFWASCYKQEHSDLVVNTLTIIDPCHLQLLHDHCRHLRCGQTETIELLRELAPAAWLPPKERCYNKTCQQDLQI